MPDCDGSEYCMAAQHIPGCFQSRRPDWSVGSAYEKTADEMSDRGVLPASRNQTIRACLERIAEATMNSEMVWENEIHADAVAALDLLNSADVIERENERGDREIARLIPDPSKSARAYSHTCGIMDSRYCACSDCNTTPDPGVGAEPTDA